MTRLSPLLLLLALACTGNEPTPEPTSEPTPTPTIVDADGDGFAEDVDCDDGNGDIHPDALETCDGVDNDCDGTVDQDASDAMDWFADTDGDGFGDADTVTSACEAPAGHVADAGDCDDTAADVHPDAQEVCGGGDEDCDGRVDDADDAPEGASTYFVDGDGDTFGDPTTPVSACVQPADAVTNDEDCNDLDAASHPGADEVCDGTDNDCDGLVDDNDDETPIDAGSWFLDVDGDQYGDPASEVRSCSPIAGRIEEGTDCDDLVAEVHPGAAEVCDGADNDCDGLADDADDDVDGTTYYADADGDLYGDDTLSVVACALPDGYTPTPGDCDDHGRPDIHPGADEVCDGADNDCDGLADDADDVLVGADTFYVDADLDGYGDILQPIAACVRPADTIENGLDCNDADPDVNPEGVEVCDGVDNDCSPLTSEEGILLLDGVEQGDDLQTLLDAATEGQTIGLCRGTYPGPFTISSDITLEGLGNAELIVLDGQGLGSTLTSEGATPIVRNLTVTGGTGTPQDDAPLELFGGGIAAEGGLFEDLQITGNSAVRGGGLLCDGCTVSGGRIHANTSAHGGGLWMNGGTLTAAVVEDNVAAVDDTVGFGGWGGGAVLLDVAATETVVRSNEAVVAGGVYLSSGVFSGGEVRGNAASDDGGGVYATDAPSIVGSTIASNTAADVGGGVVLWGDLELDDVVVEDNVARGGGGLWQYESVPDPLEVDDSDGDGLTDTEEVDVHGTDPLVEDTDGDGVPDGVEVRFELDPLSPDSDANGVSDLEHLRPRIVGSSFLRNQATDFSAGAVLILRAEVVDTRFEGNTAFLDGGGIYQYGELEGDSLSIEGSTFTGNHAVDDGGAVFAEDVDVVGSQFVGNLADDRGGAVYGSQGVLTIRRGDLLAPDNTFEGNSAFGGGAICGVGARVSVEAGVFTNNTATQGGAFEINTAEGWLAPATVSGNSADFGGVLAAVGGWTRLVADVGDGSASIAGGVAGVWGEGTLVVADSTLSGEASSGGVLHSAPDTQLIVHDSALTGTAHGVGGAINVEGETRLVRTTVTGSMAAVEGGGAYVWPNGELWMSDSAFGAAASGMINSPSDVHVDTVAIPLLPPTVTSCSDLLGGCVDAGAPEPTFYTVLEDGDGLPDVGVDADTATVVALDLQEAFFLGYAQTELGALGWTGEDCHLGTTCHPMAPDGATLTRVGTIGEVVAGSTMLLPVDYPAIATPGVTWVAIGATSGSCWVWGDDPSYYDALGCTVL